MNADQLATATLRHASRFLGLREIRPNADWDLPSTPGPDWGDAADCGRTDTLSRSCAIHAR